MINLTTLEVQRDCLATRVGKGGASTATLHRLAELNKQLEEASAEASKVMYNLNLAEEWVLKQFGINEEALATSKSFEEVYEETSNRYKEFYCK